MAKIIVSGGGATTAAHTDYINKTKGQDKRKDEKIIFNSQERNLSDDRAAVYLTSEEDVNNFIELVVSFEKTNFKQLGETDEARLLAMEKVVAESLENLWNELGVKEVVWVAGSHLNTNNPHTHIIINTSVVDAETGEKKFIPKIPRSWFWRETANENSTIAKLFEAPLSKRTLASPPAIVQTKKPPTEIALPIRETDEARINKTLERISLLSGIAPHWTEHLTNNQSLYVNRQGALTFVRRDTDGYITGYVYENGYQPEDEKGFFYVGNPKTASRFIIAETPKEVLSILELSGHRDLSEVCLIASDKKNIPVALTNHLREYSKEHPIRLIWSLGLDRTGNQETGNLDDLKVELLENRSEKAPSLEFYSWQPKNGYGNTWSQQIQARNYPGEINAVIRKLTESSITPIESLNAEQTADYYAKVNQLFLQIEVVNYDDEFIVYEKIGAERGIEYGRFERLQNSETSEYSYRLKSIAGVVIDNPQLNAPTGEETEVIARIESEYIELIGRRFLEAERAASEGEVPDDQSELKADAEQASGQTETQIYDTAADVINDTPEIKLSAKEITEKLKEIPLEDVMPTLGLSLTYDRERREYVYRDNGKQNKIKVKNDLFCDRFNDNRGGKNAINLVMHVRGDSFANARQFLIDNLGWSYIPQNTREKAVLRAEAEKERVAFVMPERNDDKLHLVKDYLTRERGLDEALINQQIENGTIFANSFGSNVFVYRNEDGVIKGAAWRAVQGSKRGDYAGTEKVDSWFYLGDIKNASRFIVVEAPIEAMSYLQLHPEIDLTTTAIVSTSMASVPTSLINLLEKNAGEKAELIIAYNNDRGGQRGVDFLLEKTGRYVLLNHKDHYLNSLIETTKFSGAIYRDVPQLEDWNEDVKALRETESYATDAEDAGAEIEAISRPEILPQVDNVELLSLEISFMEGWHTNPDNSPRQFPVFFDTINEFNLYIQGEKRPHTQYKTDVKLVFNEGSSLEQTFLIGEDLPDTLAGLINRQIELFEKMKTLPSFADQLDELNTEIAGYKYIADAVEKIQITEDQAFLKEESPELFESGEEQLKGYPPEMIRSIRISVPNYFTDVGKAEILLGRESDNAPFYNIGYRIEIDGKVIEHLPNPAEKKYAQGKESLSNAYDNARRALLDYWRKIGAPKFTEAEIKAAPDAEKLTSFLLNKLEISARDFSVRSFEKSFAVTPVFSETEIKVLRLWQNHTIEGEYAKVEDIFYREMVNAKPYQNLMYKFINEGLVDLKQEHAHTLIRGGNPLSKETLEYLNNSTLKSLELTVNEARVLALQKRSEEYANILSNRIRPEECEYYTRQFNLVNDEIKSLAETPKGENLNLVEKAAQRSPNVQEIILGKDPAADYQLLIENPLKGIYDRKAHHINVAFNEAYENDLSKTTGFSFNYRNRIVTVIDTEENGMLVNFRINDGKSQGKNLNYTLGNLIHEGIISKNDFVQMIAVSRTRQEIFTELQAAKMNLDYRAQFAADVSYTPNTTGYRINSRYSDGDYILFQNNADRTITLFKQKSEDIDGQKVYSFGDPEAVGLKTVKEVIEQIQAKEELFKTQKLEAEAADLQQQYKKVADYLAENFKDSFTVYQGEKGFSSPYALEADAQIIGYSPNAEIVVYRRDSRPGQTILVVQEDNNSNYITRNYFDANEQEQLGKDFARKLDALKPAPAVEEIKIEEIKPEALSVNYLEKLAGKPSTKEIENGLTALLNERFDKANYDFSVNIKAASDEKGAFDLFYNGANQKHPYAQYRIYPPSPEFDEWSALKNNYNPLKSQKVHNFEITDRSFESVEKLINFTAKRIIKDESLETKAVRVVPTVLESRHQEGRIEKRIAKILHAHNIAQEIATAEEFSVRLENPPYMDLHISKDYGTNLIRFTHYYEQNGDLMHDGEMNFRLTDGKLVLNQVAAGFYGTPRYSYDRTFANTFSNNLIEHGFEKATLRRSGDALDAINLEKPIDEIIEVETFDPQTAENPLERRKEIIAELQNEEPLRTNHFVSESRNGNALNVTEIVNPYGTKTWLPDEFWKGSETVNNQMIADGLTETGRTGTIYTDEPWTNLPKIHSEALAQLSLESSFTDDQIANQVENTKLFAAAAKLQKELDAEFAKDGLNNPWAVIAQTGADALEIQCRTTDGKPDGLSRYAFFQKTDTTWQIAPGVSIPQTQSKPEDFYFEEPENLRFDYQTGIRKLRDLLKEETNFSVNRLKVENRVPLGVDIEPAGVKRGTIELALEVREILHSGNAIGNNVAFNKLAEKNFGGTRAAGSFNARDAYDALELGVNLYLLDRAQTTDFTANPQETLRELRELLKRLPTQSDRTDEQNLFQQFSTPPTESFAAYMASGMKKGDIMLEPSAGNGGLAIWAKMNGNVTHVNEISERRAGILKILGFETVNRKDAQFLNDTLDHTIRPTLILMNPPFSATGGRTANNRTKYGAEHITDALNRLAEGGRLVAIVGEGMAFDKPTFTNWWTNVMSKYHVRANVGVPGEEYGKYGTTFGNQILVIDKTGKTPGANLQEQVAGIVKNQMPNLEAVLTAMQEIGETRIAPDTIIEKLEIEPTEEKVKNRTLLLPETIDLSPTEKRWFDENVENLTQAGYDTLLLQNRTIAIKAAPEYTIQDGDVRKSFMSVLSGFGNAADLQKDNDRLANRWGILADVIEGERNAQTGRIGDYELLLAPETEFLSPETQPDFGQPVYAAINTKTGEIIYADSNWREESKFDIRRTSVRQMYKSGTKNWTDKLTASIRHYRQVFPEKFKEIQKAETRIFDIGAGHLGNGTTVWNRAERENRDYKKIAHISDTKVISVYDKTLPEEALKTVYSFAIPDSSKMITFVPYSAENKNVATALVNAETGKLFVVAKNFNNDEKLQIVIENDFATAYANYENLNPEMKNGFDQMISENNSQFRDLIIRSSKNSETRNPTILGKNSATEEELPAQTVKSYAKAREEAAGAITGSRLTRLDNRGYRVIFGESTDEIKEELTGILTGQYANRLAEKGLTIEKIYFDKIETQQYIMREDLVKNPDKVYLFGDNLQKRGLGGQAKEMRGEPNAVGIPTKRFPSDSDRAYFTDEDFLDQKLAIDAAFGELAKFPPSTVIVVPSAGLGTDLADLENRAPETFAYLQEKLSSLAAQKENSAELLNAEMDVAKPSRELAARLNDHLENIGWKNVIAEVNEKAAEIPSVKIILEENGVKIHTGTVSKTGNQYLYYSVNAEVESDSIDYETMFLNLRDDVNGEQFRTATALSAAQEERLERLKTSYTESATLIKHYLSEKNRDDLDPRVFAEIENGRTIARLDLYRDEKIIGEITQSTDAYQFSIGDESSELYDAEILAQYVIAAADKVPVTEETKHVFGQNSLPEVDLDVYTNATANDAAYHFDEENNFSPNAVRHDYLTETFGLAENVTALNHKTSNNVYLTKTAELEHKKNLGKLAQDKSDLAFHIARLGEYFGKGTEDYVKRELNAHSIAITGDYDVLLGADALNYSLSDNSTAGRAAKKVDRTRRTVALSNRKRIFRRLSDT